MIKICKKLYDEDVIPHAIFWRPLRYFSNDILRGADQLDHFYAISYERGNHTRFDLRKYDGHPEFTTSLYLPIFVQSLTEIIEIVKTIINEIELPKSAVAWQRSDELDFGIRQRTAKDRLHEAEARVLALKIASLQEDRTASTEVIKNLVPEFIELTKVDLAQSTTRPREKVWQQIIGNVISHRSTPNGPFAQGYAVRTQDGLTVTDKGMSYLKSIGFSD